MVARAKAVVAGAFLVAVVAGAFLVAVVASILGGTSC